MYIVHTQYSPHGDVLIDTMQEATNCSPHSGLKFMGLHVNSLARALASS